MVCLAITRGGFGDVYRFANDDDAFLHPVVQYGDAIIPDPDDLPELYNRIEWVPLMRLADVENKNLEDAIDSLSQVEERSARREMSGRVFVGLLRKAKDPPDTADEIRAIVARDRRATDENRRKNVAVTDTRKAAADQKKAAADQKKAAADTKKAAGGGAVSTGTLNPETIVKFGSDKEGKPYSQTNIPYKAESKRHGRWRVIRDGATVKEILAGAGDSGLQARHLGDMADAGFITLTPGAAPQMKAAEGDDKSAESDGSKESQEAA